MAHVLIMPRQGNTVESCVIVDWKVNEGDQVAADTPACEVETDKATFEVPAGAAGIILKILHPAGDDVPVLEAIAVVEKLRGGIASQMKRFRVDVIEGTAEILAPPGPAGGKVCAVPASGGAAVDYECKAILVSTGSSPFLPPIPGTRENAKMVGCNAMSYPGGMMYMQLICTSIPSTTSMIRMRISRATKSTSMVLWSGASC